MANVKFNTDRFDVADLFDADGSALIIHANPDNYTNIPDTSLRPTLGNIPDRYVGYIATSQQVITTTLATGDAGGRIACGVVEKVVRREKEREGEREMEGER
jgi:Cu-Zn family superoxide dismutase